MSRGRAERDRRRALGPWLAVLGVLLVIGLRFAEPIEDGDLFWHMAYARQMLARGTVRLDHAAFSWMPAQTDAIYCAWLAELVLDLLWEHVGPWSLFALRYLVVLAVAGLAYGHVRRLGLWRSVVAHVVVLTFVLASCAGTLVKPELFSLLGINLLAYLVFRAKHAARDPADEATAVRALWAIPALLLVWVNLHGGFILAAPLLLATAAGEALNRALSPALALSRRGYRWLLATGALAALAVTATPYGLAYPWQLLADDLLSRRPRPDVAWNVAHLPLWQRLGSPPHLEELGVLMAVLLVGLLAVRAARAPRGARLDWTIVLANAAYVPLFLIWGRSSYLWPAVFAPSALTLLADVRALGDRRPAWTRWPPRHEVAAAVFVYIAGLACYEAWARPYAQSWLGFGIGYVNPVVEAEYLARHPLGPRLYNVGDSGGYLLWRLHPSYQVMADSRSFPYLSWFDELYDFVMGRNFERFLARHPADAAVIDLDKPALLDRFLAAPGWKLVFYGPTAAIFVPADRVVPAVDADLDAARVELRNGATALRVLDLATRVGDLPTARRVLARLETRLAFQVRTADLERARAGLRERDEAPLPAP